MLLGHFVRRGANRVTVRDIQLHLLSTWGYMVFLHVPDVDAITCTSTPHLARTGETHRHQTAAEGRRFCHQGFDGIFTLLERSACQHLKHEHHVRVTFCLWVIIINENDTTTTYHEDVLLAEESAYKRKSDSSVGPCHDDCPHDFFWK